jgi:hypothetical protein
LLAAVVVALKLAVAVVLAVIEQLQDFQLRLE